MLKIKDLCVNYGHFSALRNINLEVDKGEIVALLGSNGAGKTTLINTISGMVPAASGDIFFDEKNINHVPPHERVKLGIVQVPEGRKLFPQMSVYENLMMGSYLPQNRASRAENLEKCYALFPKLRERSNQLAESLSGGEQQMCAISRALMSNPRILMLDEPSLGLAPVVVDQVFDSIVQIAKGGMTVLLVEQNALATLEIADRGYVIEVGQNALSGDSEWLLNNEDMKKAYLGI